MTEREREWDEEVGDREVDEKVGRGEVDEEEVRICHYEVSHT